MTLSEQLDQFEKALMKLRLENLKMRLDIETLIDYPHGKAAKKILHRYMIRRKIRKERDLTLQN